MKKTKNKLKRMVRLTPSGNTVQDLQALDFSIIKEEDCFVVEEDCDENENWGWFVTFKDRDDDKRDDNYEHQNEVLHQPSKRRI